MNRSLARCGLLLSIGTLFAVGVGIVLTGPAEPSAFPRVAPTDSAWLESNRPGDAVQRWQPPGPSLDDWVFDLFTPPRIFFRPEDGSFLVESSLPQATEDLPDVRLAALEPTPYRFQLIGQAGEGWVILRDRESGSSRVVRSGESLSAKGHRLEVVDGAVVMVDPGLPAPLPLQLGEVVNSPIPLATIQCNGHTLAALSIGETRQYADTEVTLLRIDLPARAAEVAWRSLQTGRGRVLTLHLDAAGAALVRARDVPFSHLAQD